MARTASAPTRETGFRVADRRLAQSPGPRAFRAAMRRDLADRKPRAIAGYRRSALAPERASARGCPGAHWTTRSFLVVTRARTGRRDLWHTRATRRPRAAG